MGLEADNLEQQLEARDPDVRLMVQVRGDVAGAFETLVERYQNRLVGILFHLVGNREEAEDLCQEVFLRIYKARKGYRPRAKFSTWLFTIANNLALNHLRSKGRNPSVPIGSGGNDSQAVASVAQQLAGREGTPSAQMRQAELADLVREALAVLNEDQKLAVLLNKFEEMSYAEIADVMGRSPAAVKSLLARARNQLREQLEPYLLTGQRGTAGPCLTMISFGVPFDLGQQRFPEPISRRSQGEQVVAGWLTGLGQALDALVFPWSCCGLRCGRVERAILSDRAGGSYWSDRH